MAQVSTAVAKRTATAVKLVPLDDVVRAIHKKFAEAIDSDIKASKARLVAGVMLLDLRKRIDSGEAGDVSWWAWYEQKFVRTRKDAEKLMKLAAAEDPELAFEEERERVRIAVAKHREKKSAEKDGGYVTSKPDDGEWQETYHLCGAPTGLKVKLGKPDKVTWMTLDDGTKLEIHNYYPPKDEDEDSEPLGDSIEEARAYYAVKFVALSAEGQAEEGKKFKFLLADLLEAKKRASQ